MGGNASDKCHLELDG